MSISKVLEEPGAIGRLGAYLFGYSVGFGTLFYLGRKYLQEKDYEYQQALAEEIERTKQFYKVLHKQDISPIELAEDIIEEEPQPDTPTDWDEHDLLIDPYLGDPEDEDDEDDIETDDEDDISTEDAIEAVKATFPEAEIIAVESTDGPYEISYDLYHASSDVFEHEKLIFFREDGVLCHADGQIIYRPEEVIGLQNFRGLDGVPAVQKTVYFRDGEKTTDWVVTMEDAAYADSYIQHSYRTDRHRMPVRKFKVNDE